MKFLGLFFYILDALSDGEFSFYIHFLYLLLFYNPHYVTCIILPVLHPCNIHCYNIL
jgi:hypothetical protein